MMGPSSIIWAAASVIVATIDIVAASSLTSFGTNGDMSSRNPYLHSAIDLAHAAAPTLRPIVPRHIDTHAYDTLLPDHMATVHYHDEEADKAQPHLLAIANLTFQYPAVLLPHSAYIDWVSCEDNGLLIQFNDRGASEFVRENWNCTDEDFLMVTEPLHCNKDADPGTHIYWLVTNLEFENQDGCLKVKACASEIDVNSACGEVCTAVDMHARFDIDNALYS